MPLLPIETLYIASDNFHNATKFADSLNCYVIEVSRDMECLDIGTKNNKGKLYLVNKVKNIISSDIDGVVEKYRKLYSNEIRCIEVVFDNVYIDRSDSSDT